MSDSKFVKAVYTKNLGIFKYHPVNRDWQNNISQARIKRIANSMINEGLLLAPMTVTSKFYIVDGQHRLEAARIAGKGIYFIVDNSIPNTAKGIFDAAKRLNKNAKEWQKKDYVHGYAEQGLESYQVLEKFGEKYPMFSLTERLMLLQNSGTKHCDKKEFSDGKFQNKSLKKAEEWAENLLKLKPLFEKGYNKSVFVRAILTIMEKKKEFDFEEFLYKVKLRPSSIYLCGDKKSYIEMIEEIYNFKRSSANRLNLRF